MSRNLKEEIEDFLGEIVDRETTVEQSNKIMKLLEDYRKQEECCWYEIGYLNGWLDKEQGRPKKEKRNKES